MKVCLAVFLVSCSLFWNGLWAGSCASRKSLSNFSKSNVSSDIRADTYMKSTNVAQWLSLWPEKLQVSRGHRIDSQLPEKLALGSERETGQGHIQILTVAV